MCGVSISPLKRRHCLALRHLLPPLIPALVSARRPGSDGVLRADSHVGVDRRNASAPGVPSEGRRGGRYMGVCLHTAFWTNIRSSAGSPSVAVLPPGRATAVITEISRSSWGEREISSLLDFCIHLFFTQVLV